MRYLPNGSAPAHVGYLSPRVGTSLQEEALLRGFVVVDGRAGDFFDLARVNFAEVSTQRLIRGGADDR